MCHLLPSVRWLGCQVGGCTQIQCDKSLDEQHPAIGSTRRKVHHGWLACASAVPIRAGQSAMWSDQQVYKRIKPIAAGVHVTVRVHSVIQTMLQCWYNSSCIELLYRMASPILQPIRHYISSRGTIETICGPGMMLLFRSSAPSWAHSHWLSWTRHFWATLFSR